MNLPTGKRFPLPPTYFAVEHDREWRGITDMGRAIALFRFEALVYPVEGEQLAFHPETEGREFLRMAEAQFLVNTRHDRSGIVRVVEPHTACNCHGWVFAGGLFGIDESLVPTILVDNGYVAVGEAREGDVAVYKSGERIAHSGFVRSGSSGKGLLVESKWGPFGVYLHAPTAQPFPGECRYYRSARGGHTIGIERAR